MNGKPDEKKPQDRWLGTGASNEKKLNPDRSAILRSKSTTGTAQRDRILAALRERPHTSYELRRLGCYQAPARIKELRDWHGYGISTTRITLVDQDGYSHANAALYTLEAEPARRAQ